MPRIDEYVLCAAVHYDDGIKHDRQPDGVETGVVFCGRRHDNCIITAMIFDMNKLPYVQGFLTSHGRFLDRKESWKLAVIAKQVEDEPNNNTLFSEDLYLKSDPRETGQID